MLTFTLRRILVMIPQLLLLSLFIFILAEAMPGDAMTGIIQENPDLTTEQLHKMREMAGLNDLWYEKYFRWLGNLMHGDLGMSYLHQQPVTTLISGRLANTLLLSFFTLIVTYLISIPLGIIAGRWNDS